MISLRSLALSGSSLFVRGVRRDLVGHATVECGVSSRLAQRLGGRSGVMVEEGREEVRLIVLVSRSAQPAPVTAAATATATGMAR